MLVPVAVLLQVRAALFDPVVAVLEVEGIRPGAHDHARVRFRGEIEDALDLAAETTPSYVIVGARPDALYFEYGDYRIEEGGEYLESDGTWDN